MKNVFLGIRAELLGKSAGGYRDAGIGGYIKLYYSKIREIYAGCAKNQGGPNGIMDTAGCEKRIETFTNDR